MRYYSKQYKRSRSQIIVRRRANTKRLLSLWDIHRDTLTSKKMLCKGKLKRRKMKGSIIYGWDRYNNEARLHRVIQHHTPVNETTMAYMQPPGIRRLMEKWVRLGRVDKDRVLIPVRVIHSTTVTRGDDPTELRIEFTNPPRLINQSIKINLEGILRSGIR